METSVKEQPKDLEKNGVSDLPTIENILTSLCKTVLESLKNAH